MQKKLDEGVYMMEISKLMNQVQIVTNKKCIYTTFHFLERN